MEKMTKLGTVSENTPRGNAYDSSDITVESNEKIPNKQDPKKKKK